ncbi:hypothetical protein DFH28DRAFT_1189481, partial [Melampsora americana]
PRDWRKPFSAAVDVYCEMGRPEAELKKKSLKLTSLQQLAANCPRCFGPRVEGKREAKPDFIVCMDGNFQHRRHKAASASWRELLTLPTLFLPQEEVDKWDDCNRPTTNQDNPIDPCIASQTTANNVRGGQTWRACDKTGLFAMACQHDHLLKFINIVQSGERRVTFSHTIISF